MTSYAVITLVIILTLSITLSLRGVKGFATSNTSSAVAQTRVLTGAAQNPVLTGAAQSRRQSLAYLSSLVPLLLPPLPALAKSGDGASIRAPAFIPSPIVPTEAGCLTKDMFSDQCLEYEKKAGAYDSAKDDIAAERAKSSLKALPPLKEKLLKLQSLVDAGKLGQAFNELSSVAGSLVPVATSVDAGKGKEVKVALQDLAAACQRKEGGKAGEAAKRLLTLVDSL